MSQEPKPGSTEEMRRWIDLVKRWWDSIFPPKPPKK